MKRYQAIAFLLSTAMTVGSITPVFGASSDVMGHWAEFTITKWQNEGRIGGYEDGTFKPDKSITRAEFVRLLNSAVTATEGGSINFSDVNTNDWFYSDVAKAVSNGFASGFEDNTFRPSETVTRMQAAVFICNALKLSPNEAGANALSDAAQIPAWAKGAVGAIISGGYMSGYPDGSFGGDKGMTRAEAVSTLDRVLGKGSQTKPADPNQGVSTPDDTQKETPKEETKQQGNMVWSSGGSGGRGSSSSSSNKNDKTISVTSVSLDQNTLSLKVGESQKLTATVSPSDATNQRVRWSTSDSKIATVETDGTVTAVKEGSVTITVKTVDGKKTDTCVVTVAAAEVPKPPTPDKPTPTPKPEDPKPPVQEEDDDVALTKGSNVNGLKLQASEPEVNEETGDEIINVTLSSTEKLPNGATGIAKVDDLFELNGLVGKQCLDKYAPDAMKKNGYTLVTLALPIIQEVKNKDGTTKEIKSFKLTQTNPALYDFFLNSNAKQDTSGDKIVSKMDPKIYLVGDQKNEMGGKDTLRNTSNYAATGVYNYTFMVENGKDLEIELQWYSDELGSNSTAPTDPTAKKHKTTYKISAKDLSFSTADIVQTEAVVGLPKADGSNMPGLVMETPTVKEENGSKIVTVPVSGEIKGGALPTEGLSDSAKANAESINLAFSDKTEDKTGGWLNSNAGKLAATNGYFISTMNFPVPQNATKYKLTQTNDALLDFYFPADVSYDSSNEENNKSEWDSNIKLIGDAINGVTSAKKVSPDAIELNESSGLVTDTITNDKSKQLSFIVIPNHPVTLEFEWLKEDGTTVSTVTYIITADGVATTSKPTAKGESTPAVTTPADSGIKAKVEIDEASGDSAYTVTLSGSGSVNGGFPTDDDGTTQDVENDDIFGDTTALAASYEGQKLILTNVEVSVDGIGEDAAVMSARAAGKNVTMVQTNPALEVIQKYADVNDGEIVYDSTEKVCTWTHTFNNVTGKLSVPVLVDPESQENTVLKFTVGEGNDAKKSQYTIKTAGLSTKAPSAITGSLAAGKGNMAGLIASITEAKKADKAVTYTVALSGSGLQAGPLSQDTHNMEANAIEALNEVFMGTRYANLFTTGVVNDDSIDKEKNKGYAENDNLKNLMQNTIMMQFNVPIPNGATKWKCVKQESAMLEAYKLDDNIFGPGKDNGSTEYDKWTKVSKSDGEVVKQGESVLEFGILAAKNQNVTLVFEFMDDDGSKIQTVTYEFDGSNLAIIPYTPSTTQENAIAEISITDESKTDESKVDEPKVDEPKTDESKVDEPKTDESKVDEPKVDESKVDEPKVDEPKVDEPKVDEPKVDEPKVDEPKTDESKVDEPKTDESKTDESKVDEPKADEPKTDESKTDESKVDEPKVDESKADTTPAQNTIADEEEEEVID